jgi:peptide/nickel transport system permease protein
VAAPIPIGLKAALLDAVRTKSGMVGTGMLGFLILLAVLVPIFAPIKAWGGTTAWQDNPKLAAPEWSEVFSGGKHLPRTIFLTPSGTPGGFLKVRTTVNSSENGQWTNFTFLVLKKTIDFQADAFPSEMTLYLNTLFTQIGNVSKPPRITVTWQRPDQSNITLFDDIPALRATNINQFPNQQSNVYGISSPIKGTASYKVLDNLREWLISNNVMNRSQAYDRDFYVQPEVLLFAKVGPEMITKGTAHVLKGQYTLRIELTGFENTDDANARGIIFGTVFGLAGTDDQRHDLLVGLLWGAPVALAFGTAGALVVVLIQMILGAISGWYGGAIDELVQRAADFYLIIPTLPILIIISLLYRPSIVAILFILVAFGIVGSTTKVVRSIVLQVKEEQFIEAARSYGAKRTRILFRYILPRVMPYTFALIALTVPAFIFLEASLSFLGLGDPVLPTWGHTLGLAYNNGALFYGFWWWIVFPVSGIIFATVAFALLGYAFDKVLNPRLREQ